MLLERFCDNIHFIMKYYNKTRTIEQKVTDREILDHLKKQNVLLQSILEELKNKI